MKDKGYSFSVVTFVGGVWSLIETVCSSGDIDAGRALKKYVKAGLTELSIGHFIAAIVASILQTANAFGYRMRMMTEVEAVGVGLGLSQSTIWQIDSAIKDAGWL